MCRRNSSTQPIRSEWATEIDSFRSLYLRSDFDPQLNTYVYMSMTFSDTPWLMLKSNNPIFAPPVASRQHHASSLIQLFCQVFIVALVLPVLWTIVVGQPKTQSVKQPTEVVEVYRVCEQFQKVLSQDLNFNAAFEATFTKNKTRQRAIAVKDGEFGDLDFANIDDQTLINAYKARMQLLYLMLPLASPSDNEEAIFFPPHIKAMFTRKGPDTTAEFAAFAAQIEKDTKDFRSHLDNLAAKYPSVAERIRKFKSDLITGDFQPPKSRVVEPMKYDEDGAVLSKGESYYQIEGYTVVREGDAKKIAGIKFFTRLF